MLGESEAGSKPLDVAAGRDQARNLAVREAVVAIGGYGETS